MQRRRSADSRNIHLSLAQDADDWYVDSFSSSPATVREARAFPGLPKRRLDPNKFNFYAQMRRRIAAFNDNANSFAANFGRCAFGR